MQSDWIQATTPTTKVGRKLTRRGAVLASSLLLLVGMAAKAMADPVVQQLPFRFKAPATLAAGRSYSFIFSLYDSPDLVGATVPLWTETKSIKIPASHSITHLLGSVAPFSNDGSGLLPVDFSNQLWVEVLLGTKLVGGKRFQLAPIVPYALFSENVVAAPASVTSTTIVDGTITSADIAPGAVTSANIQDGTITSADIQDGTIANADIAPGAAIVDSKLATITTAGKVADSALSANVLLANSNQTVSGVKTFNPAAGAVPFAVDASKQGIVASLNAEMVGGSSLADLDLRFGSAAPVQFPRMNRYTTLDSTGSVGQYTSVTIGTDGLPFIVYYDVTGGNLKAVACGDAACSSGNTVRTLDGGWIINPTDVGRHASVTIGYDGFPIIAYYNASSQDLKVLHCGNATCSAGNTITTVDATGNVGQFASIAIGTDTLPVISYINATTGSLKVARCGDIACSTGNTTTTLAAASSDNTSLAIGADGRPVIAFRSVGDLIVARCAESDCSLGVALSDVSFASETPSYISLTVGADGLPVVAYYNETNGDLRVAKCGDAWCSTGNFLSIVDAAGDVGQYTSITIGTDGLPTISYYDVTNMSLKVAKCGNASCSGGNTLVTVDQRRTGIPPLVIKNPVGQHTSITIGTDGLPVIAYYDAYGGNLEVVKCANQFCLNGWSRR